MTTFGPALRMGVSALRQRARRCWVAMAWTDEELAIDAASQLEELQEVLGLHRDVDVTED
ncbi:MAG: hypothetical protein Q8N53_24885 [Longimicrobiales bacterium]|nr:hypothetical protein [Longimicrobiales bacterium]